MEPDQVLEKPHAQLSASVLIPSYRRPRDLGRCISYLAKQTLRPIQVVVVWQGDDTSTRDEALSAGMELGPTLELVHIQEPGIVAAENAALRVARGDIVLLIDDDAVASPAWIGHHLRHYANPLIGAVGGSAINYRDGHRLPTRYARPIGRLALYGKTHGNMYDHPEEWRALKPESVDHLVGYNMSFRRSLITQFEAGLRPYWQLFEFDACRQVAASGHMILFDYENVVEHYPTNRVYVAGREGDLTLKVVNASYNRAFVLSKWSPRGLRILRLLYLIGIGSTQQPGLVASPIAMVRFGRPLRELQVLRLSIKGTIAGWRAGARRRTDTRGAGFGQSDQNGETTA